MSNLEIVKENVAGALEGIMDNFKPGAKVTLLVRRPEHEDGSQDFVMTTDDLEKSIAALRIRQSEEPPRETSNG